MCSSITSSSSTAHASVWARHQPRARSRSRPSSAVSRSRRCRTSSSHLAELAAAHERRDAELALAGERLRVDRQPGLPLGAKDVVGVHVLVHQHLLALGPRQVRRSPRARRRAALRSKGRPVDAQSAGREPAHHAASSARGVNGGPAGLHRRGRSPIATSSASSWGTVRERRPGTAALEQQRAALGIVLEEADRALAVPRSGAPRPRARSRDAGTGPSGRRRSRRTRRAGSASDAVA